MFISLNISWLGDISNFKNKKRTPTQSEDCLQCKMTAHSLTIIIKCLSFTIWTLVLYSISNMNICNIEVFLYLWYGTLNRYVPVLSCRLIHAELLIFLWLGSSPRCHLQYHYLVCLENHLFIVGIEPIFNKELEFIFRSDFSDHMCVFS